MDWWIFLCTVHITLELILFLWYKIEQDLWKDAYMIKALPNFPLSPNTGRRWFRSGRTNCEVFNSGNQNYFGVLRCTHYHIDRFLHIKIITPNLTCVYSMSVSEDNKVKRKIWQNIRVGFHRMNWYQNCSDLLWEKIVLVIEKNF